MWSSQAVKGYAMSNHESHETVSALAKMGTLAARLVARATPIRLGVAHSPAELEAVHRLRCRIVIEQGWAQPVDLPDGVERDAYDDRAVQVVAWDGAVLAATSRLVLSIPGQPLPTEATFGLAIEPRGRVVDVGRVCVAPTYRGMDHRIFWALLGQTWIEMRARGFTEVCSILTPSFARTYQRWGLQVMILGAPRPFWGEKRLPALIQPAASNHTLLVQTAEQFQKGHRRGVCQTNLPHLAPNFSVQRTA
jgi:N-acyl-L-homoserine lactone synthetase